YSHRLRCRSYTKMDGSPDFLVNEPTNPVQGLFSTASSSQAYFDALAFLLCLLDDETKVL
ncbi:MAG: hypothetical protein WBQ11_19740, partial [Isosphaeraceae bacterium]